MKTYTFYYVDDSWDQDPLEVQCGVWKGPSASQAWIGYSIHVTSVTNSPSTPSKLEKADAWRSFNQVLVCIEGDHSENLQSEVNE